MCKSASKIRYYHNNISKGLCGLCSSKAKKGKTRCLKHIKKEREKYKRRNL